MINHRFHPRQTGKSPFVLAGFAVALYVLWNLSQSIAGGDYRAPLLLGAAFVAFYFVSRIAGDWRGGVYVFFAWLLCEDLVRKYMGNNMLVYFGKDLLVGVIYLSFLAACARREAVLFRPPFRHALGLFFLLGVVQVFNAHSPHLGYGVLGLKVYFYYLPLMFIGYAMLRHEEDLRRFLKATMSLAAVIALVGIIQSIVGADFLNPHSGAEIEELSHVVRMTSTGILVPRPVSVFVSEGRFGQYLILAFILGVGIAGYQLLRKSRGAWVTFTAVALVAVGVVVTGSRGAFSWTLISALVLVAGLLAGAPTHLEEGRLLARAIRRGIIFVVLALALCVGLFPSVIGARWAFYRETLSPESPEFEAGDRAWDYPVANLQVALQDPDWLTGHGIGTASLGIQYVSRILDAPPTKIGVESGAGTLILELGILGPVFWLIWAGSLLFAVSGVTFKLKGTWAFPLALAITWYAFMLLFPISWAGLTMFQNFVNNAYFWVMVGILFRLPALVGMDNNAFV
jgi:hypothetical protein